MPREARQLFAQIVSGRRRWSTLLLRLTFFCGFIGVGIVSEALIVQQGRTELRSHIADTSSALTRLHANASLLGLTQELEHRAYNGAVMRFGLRAPNGDILFDGTLGSSQRPGWVEYRRNGQSHLAFVRRLSDGATLAVASSLTDETSGAVLFARIVAVMGAMGIALTFIKALGARKSLQAMVAGLSRVADGDFGQRLKVPRHMNAFAAACDEINRVLACLERRDAEMKVALQSIAHEMRTPLSHVSQQLEILRDDEASADEKAAALEATAAKLEFVLRGYDSILRLAHLEATPGDERPRTIDLARLADNVVDAYSSTFLIEGRVIEREIKAAPISGDETLINIVVSTLLENVLRHTPPSTRAAVRTGMVAGRSFVSVADNGPGVPEQERTAITRRFYRGKNSKGLGLGLTIAESAVRRLGGELVVSDANPGLCVTLWFPAALANTAVSEAA